MPNCRFAGGSTALGRHHVRTLTPTVLEVASNNPEERRKNALQNVAGGSSPSPATPSPPTAYPGGRTESSCTGYQATDGNRRRLCASVQFSES